MTDYVFMTRPFWEEIKISEKKAREIYANYLGTEELHISS